MIMSDTPFESATFPIAHQVLAHTIGVDLAAEHLCDHGEPALSLQVLNAGTSCACHPGALTGNLRILLPSCHAPGIFGMVLALIHTERGPHAADAFQEEMLSVYAHAVRHLNQRGRDAQEDEQP
jgi:hypothetical protein